MNDLEMIKAFAELEGVDDCEQFHYNDGDGYNPITDLALNCSMRDKYEVEICYSNMTALVRDENAGEYDVGALADVKITSQGVNRAVIECILKSEGLYNEN